jgi:hypothetical protein
MRRLITAQQQLGIRHSVSADKRQLDPGSVFKNISDRSHAALREAHEGDWLTLPHDNMASVERYSLKVWSNVVKISLVERVQEHVLARHSWNEQMMPLATINWLRCTL